MSSTARRVQVFATVDRDDLLPALIRDAHIARTRALEVLWQAGTALSAARYETAEDLFVELETLAEDAYRALHRYRLGGPRIDD